MKVRVNESPYSKYCLELFTGLREQTYQYERAMRLLQLQTWMLSPSESHWKRTGTLAAVRIIAREAKRREPMRRRRAITLQRILKENPFSCLYRDFIAARGGWTILLGHMTQADIEDDIASSSPSSHLAVQMIDYAFRFATHYPDSKLTIEHCKAFVCKKEVASTESSNPLSRSLYTKAWGNFGESSPFLYVADSQFLKVPRMRGKRSIERLVERADNIEGMRLFLGRAKHVHSTIRKCNAAKKLTHLVWPDEELPTISVEALPFTAREEEMNADREALVSSMLDHTAYVPPSRRSRS